MESIELIATGFAIVLGVLAMLWAVTGLVAVVLNRPAKSPTEVPAIAAVAVPAGQAGQAGQIGQAAPAAGGVPAPHLAVPAPHLAIIAAAVATTFDTPHRIISVAGPYAHVSAWTQQGLFEHFASHRMPWRAPVARGRRIKS